MPDYPIIDIPHHMIYTLVSINNDWRRVMQTAKIFINGRSQAVRLPKEYRFSGDNVFIKKIGKMVVLLPKDDPWSSLVKSLDQFTDDFMDIRDQPNQDPREKF
jgi:antitoxin VapB